MRIRTLVGVTTATVAAALTLADPAAQAQARARSQAQARARTAAPARAVTPFDLHITNPLPCDLGGDTNGNDFATCTAPATQQWLYQLQCQKSNPRYPLVFFTNGNTVTGSGTSRASCAQFQANVIGWKIVLVS